MAYSPVSSVSTITKLVVLPAPETAKKSCKQCKTRQAIHTQVVFPNLRAATQYAFCPQVKAGLQTWLQLSTAVQHSSERLCKLHASC